ncbi:MAG: response regulator transcription factor [Pseudomonadota bacterium]
MRLMIVEDDPKIASFIVKGFRQAGFAVDLAEDGENALQIISSTAYDTAVIDIMLPGMDGLTLINRIRNQGNNTPILILSAKGSLGDRIKGLQQGGDDYLAKPFSFSELLVRVQALIRRSSGTVEPARLTYHDLTLDLIRREVARAGKKIFLNSREFSLLEYLMRNTERPVPKMMILEHIWDFHFDPQTNVVDVLVCRLRNKIDKDFPDKLIHTIRGVGYVFKHTLEDV